MRRLGYSLMLVASIVGASGCAADRRTEPAGSTAITAGDEDGDAPARSDVFTPASTHLDTSGVPQPATTSTSTTGSATTKTAITTTTSTTTTTAITTTTSTTTTTTSTITTTATTPPNSVVSSTPVGDPSPCPPTGSAIWDVRPASPLPAPQLPEGWSTTSIGTSAGGRDLPAHVRTVDAPARTVFVVGGIHGNEPVSPPAVRAMVDAAVPDDLELWLVPLLNPDGSAIGTRCNANGVDLNRNFSWNWRSSTGGPAPFSEPESAAVRALVEQLDPDLVVWVHQPLDYVSSIGATPDAYEQAWASGSGLPVRPDVTQHGGAESWTAFEAGVSSMLVEIGSWEATQAMVDAQVAGLSALLAVVATR